MVHTPDWASTHGTALIGVPGAEYPHQNGGYPSSPGLSRLNSSPLCYRCRHAAPDCPGCPGRRVLRCSFRVALRWTDLISPHLVNLQTIDWVWSCVKVRGVCFRTHLRAQVPGVAHLKQGVCRHPRPHGRFPLRGEQFPSHTEVTYLGVRGTRPAGHGRQWPHSAQLWRMQWGARCRGGFVLVTARGGIAE